MFLSVFFICNILLCTTSTFKLVNERSTNEEDHSDSHTPGLSKLRSDDYFDRHPVPDIEEFNISSSLFNEQLRNEMDILKQELEEIAKKLNHVPNSCNNTNTHNLTNTEDLQHNEHSTSYEGDELPGYNNEHYQYPYSDEDYINRNEQLIMQEIYERYKRLQEELEDLTRRIEKIKPINSANKYIYNKLTTMTFPIPIIFIITLLGLLSINNLHGLHTFTDETLEHDNDNADDSHDDDDDDDDDDGDDIEDQDYVKRLNMTSLKSSNLHHINNVIVPRNIAKLDETEESTSPSNQSLNEEMTKVQEVETTNESREHEHPASTITETEESTSPSSQSLNEETTKVQEVEITNESTEHEYPTSTITETVESTSASSQSPNDETSENQEVESTTQSTESMSHSSSIQEIVESTSPSTDNTTDHHEEIVTIKNMTILGQSTDTIPPEYRFNYTNLCSSNAIHIVNINFYVGVTLLGGTS
ncbi:hypothetical protein KSF78_0008399 [Schistosoma japonicum]|nr:hypothetical protein KSF78_0008399 [Schistosoma japonicum]